MEWREGQGCWRGSVTCLNPLGFQVQATELQPKKTGKGEIVFVLFCFFSEYPYYNMLLLLLEMEDKKKKALCFLLLQDHWQGK